VIKIAIVGVLVATTGFAAVVAASGRLLHTARATWTFA